MRGNNSNINGGNNNNSITTPIWYLGLLDIHPTLVVYMLDKILAAFHIINLNQIGQ